jgi:hypothetical protein
MMSATLFSKMRELEKLGVITTEAVYRYGMGAGERYLYKGAPVRLIPNFVGNSKMIDAEGEPVFFQEPHDLYISEETKEIIAFAKS